METVWADAPRFGRWTAAAKWGLDNALPFAVDAAWQIASDWNTDMPWGARVGRAAVAGLVGWGAGALTKAGLIAMGITLPWWGTIAIGVGIGILFEGPFVEWINEGVFSTER
jgi:hypothetical protein